MSSPYKWLGAAAGIVSSVIGGISAQKAKKEAMRKEAIARKEMDRLKGVYSGLDTSNPYAGVTNQFADLQNTMEDLTVNQQASQFQAQQFVQSQANILDSMRGAAGGSGIAATAQALASQGQLAAQQSSADIARQESQNQMAAAQQAGQLQMAEARGQADVDRLMGQGEIWSRGAELNKVSTLLGMSQAETAAYGQQAAAAEQQKWNAISSGIGALGGLGGGGGSGGFRQGGGGDQGENMMISSGNRFDVPRNRHGQATDGGGFGPDGMMNEDGSRYHPRGRDVATYAGRQSGELKWWQRASNRY